MPTSDKGWPQQMLMKVVEQQLGDIDYLFAGNPGSNLPPIVLVHGAYNSGHIWTPNFTKYFAEQGHPVYAVHLKSPAHHHQFRTLFRYSLAAYATKLGRLVDSLAQKPILIGHSMGGLVIQTYLSKVNTSVAGVCLLASLPVFGMKGTMLNMLRTPVIFLKYVALTLYPKIARTGPPPPKGLLSPRAGKEERTLIQQSLIRESGIALTNCLFPKTNIDQIKGVPLLIYGADMDNLALAHEVVKMGELLDTPAKIFANSGHFLMLEPQWKEIAEEIRETLAVPHIHGHNQ